MSIRPDDLLTGGALQGTVAQSLLASRERSAELAIGQMMGAYRVVRELGRGGMAIVYLAERDDGEYQQQVALKWMQSAQPGDVALALFERERQALANLRHAHIARLMDGGRAQDGRPWFAMEYIDGEPIDRHALTRALRLNDRIGLILQVCDALAFAHAQGVIHRDIKPSNVLVDSDGSTQLLDFGIAQLLGDDDQLAGAAFTPGFASPEQLRGEPLTVASDIYQLGRLLVATLTSDHRERNTLALHEAERMTAGSEATAMAAEPQAVSLPEGLPPDLRAVLLRALATSPRLRYASVPALANDLRAFLQCRPVEARSKTAVYLVTRAVQRHPVATGLVLLAMAILITLAGTFSLRLTHERDLGML